MRSRSVGSRALLFAILLLVVAPGVDAGFSLEEILGSPFPSGLVAAERVPRVAWVFNHKGQRDIWVAGAPDWVGRPLTDLAPDDGQAIGSLAWSPRGEHLAFVRGGSPNGDGELPNPLSVPAGIEQAVWVVSTDDSSMRRIDDGRNPLFLADGRYLVYTKGGQIWLAEIGVDDAATAAPQQLIEGRGRQGSLRLSPDGRRLAFVSRRVTHSFVGVYDFGADKVLWLDPGVDLDSSPVWSPDGTSIAFLRQPARLDTRIFGPEREGPPWSIRVADVEGGGVGREVWRAEEGRGSVFRALVADRQIFWIGDHLVFPWERDGWTHLYTLRIGGRTARLLTPGPFEVEAAAATADDRAVVFSSNEGDIDRRHLWQVSPSDLEPLAVTSGDGIEQSPRPLADGSVAYLTSDARRPLEPAVLVDGSPRLLAPALRSPAFPSEELVMPRPVVFPAADGMTIRGQLFEPPSEFTGPRPALLFFHGGSRRQMLLGWHYSSYYHNCYAFNQYMASRGFVVLSVNYRSGIGYGQEFREALNYGATGASEFQDVLGAGLYLRSLERVDGTAIALWGGSYGGYLTAMGLARASDLFAAGVDVHGVHDWRRTTKNFVPSYDPSEDPERARLAFESSPLASIDTWRSPVLLIHGDDDRNVPFTETVELVQKLRARRVEVELLVLPDEVHGFLVHSHWLEVFHRSAEFLERRLAPGS